MFAFYIYTAAALWSGFSSSWMVAIILMDVLDCLYWFKSRISTSLCYLLSISLARVNSANIFRPQFINAV